LLQSHRIYSKLPRLEWPPNSSGRWGSKQSTEFCTGWGKLRNLGTLIPGLSAYRCHPVSHSL
jgi:hypothetical protein